VSAANGIHVPPKSYWEGLRRIADKYQIVLISDEVINAFGRLGEWFGAQCFGVQPDITTVAKGITSGYAPLGAVIATKKIADSFLGGQKEMFYHLITFGGHPISTAAANANIEIIEEENLVENSKLMGNYLFEKLQELLKYSIVGDVRGGLGLLAAVEIVKDKESKEKFPIEMQLMKKITNNLFSNGIVSFRAGDVISICPPLSINKSEINFMVEGINASIKTFSDSL
jgi:putrescine aminotransferase